jgi:hypothetical protein
MKAFYRLRKAYMTLLETLVAISLLSMLLVFVFGFFRELSEIARITEQSQKQSFQMRYLESRLNFIFERVVNENESSLRPFFFYTQPVNHNFSSASSLILTFDNEVRLDPTFSGDVLGRMYVDLDKRLCLVIWPLHVSEPNQYMQEEILMDNVVDVSYSFYAAPARIKDGKEFDFGEKIDPEKKTPEKDKWHQDWLVSYKQMPSIMKMIVKVANATASADQDKVKEYVFHFVLPSSKNYVYYPPGELSS